MPRRVTLAFDHGDTLVMRTGSLVDSSATTLTVRLEAPLTAEVEPIDGPAPPAPVDATGAALEAPSEPPPALAAPIIAPDPPAGGAPIVAVVHAPGDGSGSAFLMTTRLAGSDDPLVVRLARAGHAP